MKRTILTVLALASLSLMATGANHAQAAWYHSGWFFSGTWTNFALSSSNQASFAVSTPIGEWQKTTSANTSTDTWHWATTLCSNGVQTLGFQYPFTNPIANPTLGTAVGGVTNSNKTKLCSG